jgi:uncharacterized protein YecT (DUF1311 family)
VRGRLAIEGTEEVFLVSTVFALFPARKRMLFCLLLMGLSTSACAEDISPDDIEDIQASSEAIGLRQPYIDCVGGGAMTTAAILQCAHEEFAYQDDRLNRNYKMAMSKLSQDGKTRLRTEERQWLEELRRRCEFPEDGGTAHQTVSADCEVEEAAKRAADLGRLIRR